MKSRIHELFMVAINISLLLVVSLSCSKSPKQIAVEKMSSEEKKVEILNASKNGDSEMVKLLLDAGVPISGADNTAMITAAKNSRADVVQLLITAGADVNAKDDFGSTALMNASIDSSLEIVKLLLAAKADVNAKDVSGSTALINASLTGRPEIVKLLIASGADINAKNLCGVTALMAASQKNLLGFFLYGKYRSVSSDDKGRAGVAEILKAAGARE